MDIHERIEQNLRKLREIAKRDVYGNPVERKPCDDLATFRIEDCSRCKAPCEER